MTAEVIDLTDKLQLKLLIQLINNSWSYWYISGLKYKTWICQMIRWCFNPVVNELNVTEALQEFYGSRSKIKYWWSTRSGKRRIPSHKYDYVLETEALWLQEISPKCKTLFLGEADAEKHYSVHRILQTPCARKYLVDENWHRICETFCEL